MFECSVRRLRASKNGKQNGWSMKQLVFFTPMLEVFSKNCGSETWFLSIWLFLFKLVIFKKSALEGNTKETSSEQLSAGLFFLLECTFKASRKKKRKSNWPLYFLHHREHDDFFLPHLSRVVPLWVDHGGLFKVNSRRIPPHSVFH